jgi:hypothetical protein
MNATNNNMSSSLCMNDINQLHQEMGLAAWRLGKTLQ